MLAGAGAVPAVVCPRKSNAGTVPPRWRPTRRSASARSVWCNLGFGPFPEIAPDGKAPRSPLRSFGEYELIEQIGRGGMGVVYKARHLATEQVVAVKMILDAELASEAVIERFRIEAETAARLDHPNIVPIYEIGDHQGRQYFTMEWIAGNSLADRIATSQYQLIDTDAGGSLSLVRERQAMIARLMSTLGRAVHYAHHHGILHRDIKPSNILFDQEDRPYLTDFGVAKLLDREQAMTQTGALLGTLSYMSPEQASGGAINPTSDVYSLGAILYELLTGRAPFAAETPAATMREVMEREPTDPRTINPLVDRRLATICLKALEKDPGRRYSTALMFAEDLERWEKREPILARPAGLVLRTRRWSRRNPAVATLLVALTVGLTISLWLLHSVNQNRAAKERLLAVLWEDLAQDLTESWEDPAKTAITISSEKLAAMTGTRGLEVVSAAKPIRLLIGIHSNDGKPVDRARDYAPLLAELERMMGRELHKPVRLDFRMDKYGDGAREALLAGQVQITLLGAYSYLLARESDPSITPLIRAKASEESRTWMIFARKDTGIQSLAQLRGRSMAVGFRSSTASGFWAPHFLFATGLRATNLASYTFHSVEGEALRAVQDNAAEAGVISLTEMNSAKKRKKLVPLKEFPVMPPVWATRTAATPEAAAFQSALLRLDRGTVEGVFGQGEFERASDGDFTEMRAVEPYVKAFFEGSRY